MSDKHFSYEEVIEYGMFWYEQTANLEGQATLVDVAAMRARILARVQAVQQEMQRTGLQRIALRAGRGGIATATTNAVGVMKRFHFHVHAAPPELGCDPVSFFPRGSRFAEWRKPADVLARVDEALLAFDAPVNALLPSREEWQGSLTGARSSLAQALTGRQSSQLAESSATSALIEARRAFVKDYNGLAKGVVRLALRELGREHEYRRYFRDLQLHGGVTAPPATEPPATEPPATEPPAAPAQPGAPASEPAAG